MTADLRNKVAIVTGGTSGIGREAALLSPKLAPKPSSRAVGKGKGTRPSTSSGSPVAMAYS
jgi:hypothetical protein